MGIYTINEQAAREAHTMNSMRDYKEGSATAAYQQYISDAERIAERQKELHPEQAERIDYLLDLYARKLAAWFNEGFRIESMCPSILVSGGSNFPTRKKEKQNARRSAHTKDYESIENILHKIKIAGTGGIMSGDEMAIEKLEAKIESLEDQRKKMKDINAYYRKHGTCTGCESCSEGTAKEINESIERSVYGNKPFAAWQIQNLGAEIRRLTKRLESLKSVKEAGTNEKEIEGIEGLTVIENAEAMRIQLVFDEKPDEDTRKVLKSNGFKWAPSQGAWQRNLNDNGKRAAQRVFEELKGAQE